MYPPRLLKYKKDLNTHCSTNDYFGVETFYFRLSVTIKIELQDDTFNKTVICLQQ